MMALATLLPFNAIFFLSFSELCRKKMIEAEKHCYMCVCVWGVVSLGGLSSELKLHFHEQWRLSAIGL